MKDDNPPAFPVVYISHDGEGRDTEAGMAHDAYSLADAMLAERQKALAAAALKARGV